MRKLFIITLGPDTNTSDIRRRIERLGDYYTLYNNQYLVFADIEDAQSVYSRIAQESTVLGIVILGIPLDKLTYWGYTDKELWKWLEKAIHKDSV